ncbi:glycoside hydrolase family 3 protein [Bacteroides sedimenti]|uniref:Glucan 1,4-alpha-glucosidase n=1 Tax=Bacteroides sedimenti TaxID=2136147 RepID=A0ABN6Z6N5_9BACE
MGRFLLAYLFFYFTFQVNYAQSTYPWADISLPLDVRVDKLIKSMTINEKIGQMMNDSPAIERLGIPHYNWWNECLHGVARAGLATVYPQAIGLAATFDDKALFHSAELISDEARAKYTDFVKKGSREIYQGLTYWSPNINIFRDPRWGRGQETYGEDPFLTGCMGAAFVKGLQGNQSNYLKLVATAKHFAVHSGPEYERHVMNAVVSPFDLWDTYLPAFHKLVRDASVASVMCAYNRFDGEPCCGSNTLLTDILRNMWGFKGYIVSDCGAIDDFYKTHKISINGVDSSVKAVRAGTDLECGNTYENLLSAFNKGEIKEYEIDEALHRLFIARFRLGLFSPDSLNPYANIPYSVVDSKDHRQDALNMACKSVVLLKNENDILPLSKSLRKIAIIGPAATDSVSILGNYNGTPGKLVTVLQGIKNKVSTETEVVFKQGVNYLDNKITMPINLWPMIFNEDKNGMKAEYFNNIKLEGTPVLTRIENGINFKGGVNDEIAPGIKARWISVRWTGKFIPNDDGDYTFCISGDDGFRLFIDNEIAIDHFSFHEEMSDTYTLHVKKGKKYDLRLEYFQGDQGVSIRFGGVNIQETNYEELANEVSDADAIIFVGGISPRLEGEEMPVNLPGFKRGDRTTIALPEVQTKMMQALYRTGKPVIFVMQIGSALSINWENSYLAAIVNAWYGGQAAGEAVADILFGDYNPAGRLPITFYCSDNDLPPYNDYSMKGRTYRYFTKETLYPFGYGLSYTNFSYSGLKVPDKIITGKDVSVSVDVKNIGKMDGDEVVQLYLIHHSSDSTIPRCALKGFKRISLKRGESKTVSFNLTPEDLSLVSSNGRLRQIPDKVSVFIGGGQPHTIGGINGVFSDTKILGPVFYCN